MRVLEMKGQKINVQNNNNSLASSFIVEFYRNHNPRLDLEIINFITGHHLRLMGDFDTVLLMLKLVFLVLIICLLASLMFCLMFLLTWLACSDALLTEARSMALF